ncbi:hypothetical protein GG804_12505 [Sphingomonas histidinilytica]|jgi:hypothetical protein|uniref:Uncharacterized protein n=1 Tax=Rhizorhabdus histidinilytica TaxID=439228 RepID=A0A1T4ZTM1_9SPHN|nr:hypothetical protein [Rhizorhabdus histidinilytica]MBO9377591.1 hypothetical protein [Rhizorhabdus histidinilytica]QEH78647.1 hypothetical protein EIK56_10975 [Sphingomonas sp. C8-2]SKB26134.1 hypothetical protein SAMN06295920_101217 [Rhizorhabdus histidinilytica]
MLKTAFRFLALTTAIAGLGTTIVMGAAEAATTTGDVPFCSKTITDKCMDRPAAATHHATRHAAHHRTHKPTAAKAAHPKG